MWSLDLRWVVIQTQIESLGVSDAHELALALARAHAPRLRIKS